MFRAVLAAILALWACDAGAIPNLLPAAGAGGPPGGAAPYTGPGDIVSGATAFYGLRAYTQAIANAGTQKLANIRRASDAQTCDFLVVSNGGVGNSANCSGAFGTGSLSSFCNATTCTATKLYDQSGNANDISQATVAAQPTVTLNCLGSLPCLTFASASSQELGKASLTLVNQPFTTTGVVDYTGTCASSCEILSTYDGTNGNTFELTNSTTIAIFTGSSITGTTSGSAWRNYSGVYNGASSNIYADATSVASGTVGSGGTGNGIWMGALTGTSRFFQGSMAEAGFWPVAFTGTQEANMCHNQFSYWGTATTC